MNRDNGLGFPGKSIRLRWGWRSADLVTGLGGCADIPAGLWFGARVSFAGDDAVAAASGRVLPWRT